MTEVLLVARREFRIQARSKGFVIGLLISSLVIVLIIALPQLLGSDDTYEVGLAGTESEALSAVVVSTADEIGISVETELYDGILLVLKEAGKSDKHDPPHECECSRGKQLSGLG